MESKMTKGSMVLTNINSIDELLRFLENELDWPINGYDKDELSFEYSADELGLKEDEAAKIKSVFQLRPLEHAQPWGVFFIEFEKKKLPIVVMRRILSALVKKRRRNKAKQYTWDKHDLLFISRHGEDDDPHITFAHFEGDEESVDLPKLKVLGWDGDDTVLKLDHVMKELKDKLRWPNDTKDISAWRKTWASAFSLRHNEVIRTSQELALHLAELARGIRKRALKILSMETKKGRLRTLKKEFKEALIHDLEDKDFADMYAQTISYGLLAARVSRPAGIIADNVKDMVPMTNPFLRDMLSIFLTAGGRDHQRGMDFDELGVQDVVELLNHCNMEAVLRDFGNRTRQEDPVIHFYELFLKAYDAEMKVKRGVFYTPQPVVSYIVRSVHELLQTEFGLQDGLASTVTWEEMSKKHPDLKIPEGTSPKSPFVVILDPATGTGTFLVEVIDVIHRTVIDKWKKAGIKETQIKDAWNKYVPTNLLPRLFGYELMMAPYAIAHMKIGLKLHETGYTFSDGENARANIYLTNALEPASESSVQLGFDMFTTPLADEAKAVNEIKRNQRFTVVVGNPPYAALSSNLSSELKRIVDPYRAVEGQAIRERSMLQFEKNIQDDYVKFFALAQSKLLESHLGLCALISNHSYLDGPTLRGMRWNLLTCFSHCFFLDLHGNANKAEVSPTTGRDENVFDIRQGVAICALVLSPEAGFRNVRVAELWGPREDKYHFLGSHNVKDTHWHAIEPHLPYFYLVQPEAEDISAEWEEAPAICDLFLKRSTGSESGFDDLLVGFTQQELQERIHSFAGLKSSEQAQAEGLDVSEGHAAVLYSRRNEFRTARDEEFCRFQLRAYDYRWAFLRKELLKTNSFNVMLDLSNNTPGMVTTRQTKENFSAFAASGFCGHKVASSYDRSYVLPLFARDTAGLLASKTVCLAQSHMEIYRGLLDSQGLNSHVIWDEHAIAMDIFRYAIALMNAPSYALKFGKKLRRDWPRVPYPATLEFWQDLAKLGGELVSFHLMESPKLDKHISRFTGKGDNSIPKKPTYKDGAVWINSTQRFEGVPEEVWNFYIGGYQVCEKWLKDRKGRILSTEDIEHYNKIVVALNETIRIMKEIDEVIEKHGGWPDAFVTKS